MFLYPRTPLVGALGSGTPKEFEDELRVFENDPDLGYCYPSIFSNKDYVLLAYFIVGDTYGYDDVDMNLYGIRIKKVSLDEL